MKLWEIMDKNLYLEMREDGYIRSNVHPDHPLWILNYTENAQFDQAWNEVTLQCRGLIVDSQENVVARPFDKFFNYGETHADRIEPDMQVDVTNKMDGSLGILWQWHGYQGIATRGSFISDQAIHATEIWNRKYKTAFHVPENMTYMFEIIYPENRIVLDYGDLDDLVLIGARDILGGSTFLPNGLPGWKWHKAKTYHYKTLQEALEAPPRPNAEGYVVFANWYGENGGRVKIKQEDYMQLHKIVTGLTKRRIWENMKSGQTLEDLCAIVPDEWHDWLRKTYKEITDDFNITFGNILHDFDLAVFDVHHWWLDATDIGFKEARKAFAGRVKGMQYQGLMFQLLDKKDITMKVWDIIKPSAE